MLVCNLKKVKIKDKVNGYYSVNSGKPSFQPYYFQNDAKHNLDIMNKMDSFSTLVVLPTGGGKTFTVTSWLLTNAVDKNIKVLWIAHRQMLLDQALRGFDNNTFLTYLPNRSKYHYRIISGNHPKHDRVSDIEAKDDVIIASKDSLIRNLDALDVWLENEDVVFLVIDEAHHSTAKSYRKIIDYVKSKVKNIKIIGLTATPVRTIKEEEGLLTNIFNDRISNNIPVHDEHTLGICYEIGLSELIKSNYLAKPVPVEPKTPFNFEGVFGVDDLNTINRTGYLPKDIEEELAENATRNRMILEHYLDNKDKYGKTLIFAINRIQATQLYALFTDKGIKADFVISGEVDDVGITKKSDNNKIINKFISDELDVLINVNILSEGSDIPQIKTVFLTRPTISNILMTQMVGRALRGPKTKGGTKIAYIVSFIDNWNDQVQWEPISNVFRDEINGFVDEQTNRQKYDLQVISLKKIEEFARILDGSIDSEKLQCIPFVERIPIGMYTFKYLENDKYDDCNDVSHQIIVYNSTKDAYENMLNEIGPLFERYGIHDEYLTDEQLTILEEKCREVFFTGEMIPPYNSKDIVALLKFYAQKEEKPFFHVFDLDKDELDVSNIAVEILKKGRGDLERKNYLDSIWESDDNLINIFYANRKKFFREQVNIEIDKLLYPEDYVFTSHMIPSDGNILKLPLFEIKKYDKEYEKELRDVTFEKALDKDGYYVCQDKNCNFKSKNRVDFEIDHKQPLNKKGLSVPENLQILCPTCNRIKSDKY